MRSSWRVAFLFCRRLSTNNSKQKTIWGGCGRVTESTCACKPLSPLPGFRGRSKNSTVCCSFLGLAHGRSAERNKRKMDLAAFLEALPRASLASLYASPAACAAVLRGLSPLARLYVARLAHLEDGAPEGAKGD